MSDPRTFPCHGCGADLSFEPGTTRLSCPYCAATVDIGVGKGRVRELDYAAHVATAGRESPRIEASAVHCEKCGATSTLAPGVSAERCPFCAAPMVGQGTAVQSLRPQGVLPFKITKEEAGAAFEKWIGSRWFAPDDLLPSHIREGLGGMYVPFFTYDTRATASYRGERGDRIRVTRQVQEKDAQGNTRVVQKEESEIRWSPASGHVQVRFDDVLACASRSLPEGQVSGLEPWDLGELVDYDDRFIAGFRCEIAQLSVAEGFDLAKKTMRRRIEDAIEDDIGGDEQRISHFDPQYHDVSFKHVLLPMWISAFRFGDKAFRVVVNGRTGEVEGQRPWSGWKIGIFVVMLVAEITLAIYYWPAAVVLAILWIGAVLLRRR